MADRSDVTFTVKRESKYPPKDGGFSYQCDIDGTECFLDVKEGLHVGAIYKAASITNLARRGKNQTLYGAAAGITPICAPRATAAPTSGASGYPAKAYLALDDMVGKQVQGYGEEESPEFKAATYGCMFIAMSRDPVVMGALAGGSDKPDAARQHVEDSEPREEPPADDDIPF